MWFWEGVVLGVRDQGLGFGARGLGERGEGRDKGQRVEGWWCCVVWVREEEGGGREKGGGNTGTFQCCEAGADPVLVGRQARKMHRLGAELLCSPHIDGATGRNKRAASA